MRSERNPLDLNNLPEDYGRDRDKHATEESSTTVHRKQRSGANDGKDESGKVYECRFCSLKFCKSQALGGHMNRHRQERETETLNRARQLVFSNDTIAPPQPPHLGCCHPITPGSYHSATGIGDPAPLPFRFPTTARMFSGSSSSTLLPPQSHQLKPSHQPYLYTSPSRPTSFPAHYPHQHSSNDYFVGHVLGNALQYNPQNASVESGAMEPSSYTCIGAPVGHGFGGGGPGRMSEVLGGGGGRDGSGQNHQEVGLNWGRHLDVPSFKSVSRWVLNRFSRDSFECYY